MSNPLSIFQFKEEYQKLEQQSNKINKDIENLLCQKMDETISTIIELKKINFTFTHPNDNTLRTKHGAIMGVNSKHLYVYCGEAAHTIHLVDKTTDTIISDIASILFLKDFIYFCDVAFAFRGLESLEEQMRNCLTSLEEQNKQRLQLLDSRLNSNS